MDKVVIIGGTGTLGSEMLNRYYGILDKEIHVVSRGEHKQQEFKKKYTRPDVKFHICDIRDKQALSPILKGAKLVFHFAALKAIDVCEDNPIECIKTNIVGTINVAELCIEHDVKRCIFSSTDKAVDPISSYGYAKALSENILRDFNHKQKVCKFIVFRWGNILNSQGSVIPQFIEKIKKGLPVHITKGDMTRFFIRIEDAVSFVLRELQKTNEEFCNKTVLIPPNIRSARVIDVIGVIADLCDKKTSTTVVNMGVRGIEKTHEQMISVYYEKPISSKDCLMTNTELRKLLIPLVF